MAVGYREKDGSSAVQQDTARKTGKTEEAGDRARASVCVFFVLFSNSSSHEDRRTEGTLNGLLTERLPVKNIETIPYPQGRR